MDLTQLQQALAQPAGAGRSLLEPALKAYFSNQLRGELDVGGRRCQLNRPPDADAVFRHLAGGTWASELVRQRLVAMAFDWVLSLGFRDAPFADVEAFAAINEIPLARILDARDGIDPPQVLLDYSKRASTRRKKSAALAAAIAVMQPVPVGVEAELELNEAGWAPLMRKALRALGPERASEVALRQLRSADGETSSDRALFQSQALSSVLECFGPYLTPSAEQVVAERIEALASVRAQSWEAAGERLARSGEWEAVIRFVSGRLPGHAGWRRAMRPILGARVRTGWAIPPELDELVDPGAAAKLGYDEWKVVLQLLRALPAERAEKLLADATYERPADALRFLIPGLSEAMLARLAQLHVSLRDEPTAKDALIATDLRPLGAAFGPALQAALAEVKPKPGYLKALQRNLDPPVFAALSTWLEQRPPPKAKRARKPAGSSAPTKR